MRPPCFSCLEETARVTCRCGELCEGCAAKYRREYATYKSEPLAEVQIALRKRFAERWFSGSMDLAHEHSIQKLQLTLQLTWRSRSDSSQPLRRPLRRQGEGVTCTQQ